MIIRLSETWVVVPEHAEVSETVYNTIFYDDSEFPYDLKLKPIDANHSVCSNFNSRNKRG